jgi:hypothetical protein
VRRFPAAKPALRLKGQQAGFAGQLDHLGSEVLVGTVSGQTRIALKGHDFVSDERTDLVSSRRDVSRYLEINH